MVYDKGSYSIFAWQAVTTDRASVTSEILTISGLGIANHVILRRNARERSEGQRTLGNGEETVADAPRAMSATVVQYSVFCFIDGHIGACGGA